MTKFIDVTGGSSVAPTKQCEDLENLYLFGRIERWTISFVAFALHSLSLLYLISFSYVYLIVTPEYTNVLHAFYPRVQVVFFAAVAVLHIRGLLLVFMSPCLSTTNTPFEPHFKPKTYFGKIKHVYIRYFSRYGAFGLHGELFDMRVAFKQAIQIPSQGYQAYQMSIYLTDPLLTTVYTLLLACDCIFVPILLFSKSQFTRRWGPGFVDSIFDFSLSAGLPLGIILRGMVEVFVLHSDIVLMDKTWLNRMIMMGRFVAVTNVADMFSTLFPFITCCYSLTNLNEAVRLRRQDMEVHSTSLKRAKSVVKCLKYKSTILQVSRGVFLIVSAIASIFFCVMAGTSLDREACPDGCLLQSYPWFSKACNCLMMRQNCILYPLPLGQDIDKYLQLVAPNVFDLQISQCDMPQGLSLATLQSMQNLYSLTLRQTNTTIWDIEPQYIPPSMYTIYFQDQQVPQLPLFVHEITHNIHYLFFRNVTFTANKTMPQFRQLYMLSLTNAGLTAIPTSVFSLEELALLELDYNLLTEIPIEVAQLRKLVTLSLMFNTISMVPNTFLRDFPSTLAVVYLNGNPIHSLPSDTDLTLLTSSRLVIRGTPLCNRILDAKTTQNTTTLNDLERQILLHSSTICGPDCNVGCHDKFRGNAVCNNECMTPSCTFDADPISYENIGVQASDCYILLTGWEPTRALDRRP